MPNACGHRIGSDKLFIKRYLFALDIVLVDILRNKWVGRAIPIPRDPRPHRPSRVCAGTDRTSQNHRSGHMLRPHAPATCSGASHGQAQAFAGSGLRNGRRNRRPAVDRAERHKRMSCKAIRDRARHENPILRILRASAAAARILLRTRLTGFPAPPARAFPSRRRPAMRTRCAKKRAQKKWCRRCARFGFARPSRRPCHWHTACATARLEAELRGRRTSGSPLHVLR